MWVEGEGDDQGAALALMLARCHVWDRGGDTVAGSAWVWVTIVWTPNLELGTECVTAYRTGAKKALTLSVTDLYGTKVCVFLQNPGPGRRAGG